ncbi:MAG: hypothetical protein ACLFTH_02360 [Candidatus Woesearchaeota archaeon]
MIIIKVFGFLDFLIALLLFLTPDNLAPQRLLIGGALFLIAKGIIYKGDLLSTVDMVIGAYCLFALFHPLLLVSFLAGGYLFIKGFYSIVT